jgi:RNase P/RNase MRP subunit POP5
MRVKVRHLLIRIIYDDGITDPTVVLPQIAKALNNSIEYYYGDYGNIPLRYGYQVKYFNSITGLCLIRVPRNFCQTVVYSTTNVKKLNGKGVKLDILHISGTINRCQQIAIELSRQYLKEFALQAYLQGEKDKEKEMGSSVSEGYEQKIILTTDGDIIVDQNTLENIAQIEQEISQIDAVQ